MNKEKVILYIVLSIFALTFILKLVFVGTQFGDLLNNLQLVLAFVLAGICLKIKKDDNINSNK